MDITFSKCLVIHAVARTYISYCVYDGPSLVASLLFISVVVASFFIGPGVERVFPSPFQV